MVTKVQMHFITLRVLWFSDNCRKQLSLAQLIYVNFLHQSAWAFFRHPLFVNLFPQKLEFIFHQSKNLTWVGGSHVQKRQANI